MAACRPRLQPVRGSTFAVLRAYSGSRNGERVIDDRLGDCRRGYQQFFLPYLMPFDALLIRQDRRQDEYGEVRTTRQPGSGRVGQPAKEVGLEMTGTK